MNRNNHLSLTLSLALKKKFVIMLFVAVGVILNSCQSNIDPPENGKIYTQSEIENAKQWYDTFTFNKPQKAEIFSEKISSSTARDHRQNLSDVNLDWTNAVAVKSGEKIIVEIPVYSNFEFSTDPDRNNRKRLNAKSSLVIITTPKSREGYFMSVVSPDNYDEKVTYIKQPKSFSGSLLYHTLQGRLIAVQKYDNGAVVGIGTPATRKSNIAAKSSTELTPMLVQLQCVTYDVYNNWSVCVGENCQYFSEYTGSYTVCYDAGGGGGGGGGGDTGGGGGGGGGGTVPNPQPCIPVAVSSIGPVPMALGFNVNVVNPNDPGAPTPPTPPVPCPTTNEPVLPVVLREVKITALKPCAKAIYNSLLSLNDAGMSNVLNMFNRPASFGYNWTLKNGTLDPGENARTNNNSAANLATTTFDMSKFADASDLALARTILHEAAHAYLVRYFDMDLTGASREFSDLLEIYRTVHPNDDNASHHEAFVNSYVQKIAQTLRAYGDSKGYTFPTLAQKNQFYQEMAWGGLEGTNAFKGLPDSIKKSITNTIQVEQYQTNTEGFNTTQKGTKLKC